MSKLTLIIFLIFCAVLVILPLWGSSQGYGSSTAETDRTTRSNSSSSSVRYIGSRSSRGGGTSSGK